MEKQYSVQFFTTFVDNLQQLCQNYLNFSQFVEITGYISVEMDNLKKERYVLSELLQSSGNVVSESFCTKAFETPHNVLSSLNSNAQCGSRTPRERKNRTGDLTQPTRSPLYYSAEMARPTKYIRKDVESYSSYQPCASDYLQEYANLSRKHASVPEQMTSVPDQMTSVPDQMCLGQNQVCSIQDQVSFPQTWPPRSPLSRSTSSTLSKPSDGEAFPNDNIIDLDLIDDDDLELPMDECGKEATGVVVPLQHPAMSHVHDQPLRHSTLSAASLATIRYTVKQFTRFHFNQSGQQLDLLALAPETLDAMLSQFFCEGKKVSGGELKPRSLQNVHACLHRYLKDGGYPYSILKSPEFEGSREVLKKRLTEIMKNLVPTYSRVNEGDIKLLFMNGFLGCGGAEVLVNTMWFLNTRYFRKRSPSAHFNMKWGDVVLKVDESGWEYLECQVNAASQKVFAETQHPDRCLIKFYKQYMELRPKIAMEDGYAFYLSLSEGARHEQVFIPEPMPMAQLAAIWKTLLDCSGLPSNKVIL